MDDEALKRTEKEAASRDGAVDERWHREIDEIIRGVRESHSLDEVTVGKLAFAVFLSEPGGFFHVHPCSTEPTPESCLQVRMEFRADNFRRALTERANEMKRGVGHAVALRTLPDRCGEVQ